MTQSWKNLVMGGRVGGQMDKSDFMGGCPTNVERPVHTKNVEQQSLKKYFLAVFL